MGPEAVVRLMYERFNSRDFDGALELIEPEVEWDWSLSLGPDRGVWHGHDGVRSFIDDQWQAWDEIRIEPEEVLGSGNTLVVMVRVTLRGRQGIAVEARGPHLAELRDGRVHRYRLFQEREAALAAAGLAVS